MNVRTGSEDAWAIRATTMLESIPPESNAPSGTSATSRLRTASSHRPAHAFQPLLLAGARVGRLCPPVALDPFAVSFGDEHVSGWKLVDPAQSGPLAGHVLQRKIRIERLQVDVSRDLRQAQ